MTREELENEIFISVIRDLLFFLFVNRARDPPCTTLNEPFVRRWNLLYGIALPDKREIQVPLKVNASQ